MVAGGVHVHDDTSVVAMIRCASTQDAQSLIAGAERWLGRALDAGVSPPWLIAITVPTTTATEPDEHALLEAPWELVRSERTALAVDPKILWNPLRRIGEAREPRTPSLAELSVVFMAAAPSGVSTLSFEEAHSGTV